MRTGLKILVVILTLLAIMFLLDKTYEFGYRHNQNVKVTRIQRAINADILFLGPCEPHWSISPGMLQNYVNEKIYNLALNNSDFADNYLHLHLYLKTNKAPAFVFLYVTPASFDEHTNVFNSFRFATHLADQVVDSVVNDCDPDYGSWSVLPFMKYAYYNSELTFNVLQGYRHFLTDRTEAYYDDGYEPPAEQAQNVKEGRLILLNNAVEYTWSKKREEYLLKIIRLAQAIGTQVVLYESPVYEPYLQLEVNRAELEHRIRKIAEQERVTFFQFKDLDIANDPFNFNAPRNFNRKGVVLFSDTLGRYLNAMIHDNKKEKF